MNVYELVTARIVERWEEGVIPWRKCWTSGPAKSLTTGKEYCGLNSLLCELNRPGPCSSFPAQRFTLGFRTLRGFRADIPGFAHWGCAQPSVNRSRRGKELPSPKEVVGDAAVELRS
jgi:hypothetical protein